MGGHWPAPVTVSAVHRAGHCGRLRGCECDCEWQELPARAAGGCGSLPPAPLPATWQGWCSTAGRQLCWPSSGDTGRGGSLQAGPELPPNAPQVCVDGGCYTLGKVVRPGLEGVPQSTLLGVLLALLLLVAVLAAILVFSYHRRKQLGEPSTAILTQPSPPNYDVSKPLYPLSLCPGLGGLPTPPGSGSASRTLEWLATSRHLSTVLSSNLEDLASLDRTPGAVPLPLLRSGSDYRNGLGEMLEVLGGTILSAPPAPHSFSSSTAPPITGQDSSTQVHRISSSDSGDGSRVPLLRKGSIQLGDLDSVLLAEVKDVLIPHERVVTHADRVIGKGMGARPGGAGERWSPEMTWA